jgi:hypothetical protein
MKKNYSFPRYGVTIQAESHDEAVKILREKFPDDRDLNPETPSEDEVVETKGIPKAAVNKGIPKKVTNK